MFREVVVGSIGTTELIIIAFVLVLLFGAKRLPETARGIGRSLKVFKSEIQDDDQNAALANPEAADTEPDTEPDTEHGKSVHAAAESSSQTGPASSGRPTSADVA